MKKITLLGLAACLGFSVALTAQVQPTPPESGFTQVPAAPDRGSGMHWTKVRLGIYAAPSLCWMRPTAAKDDENQFNIARDGSDIGFTYGLMMDYFFADNYGIATGIQVSYNGGGLIATNVDQSAATAGKVLKADFDYRLQYIEIPLTLKLRTDDVNGFRFFGQLGASLGINIGKKADYQVSYTPDPTNGSTVSDTSGHNVMLSGNITTIAPIVLQMNIGAGLEYPIAKKLSFYTGIFFNNGFAPDATSPEKYNNGNRLGYNGSFKDGTIRLNSLALRVGLFF